MSTLNMSTRYKHTRYENIHYDMKTLVVGINTKSTHATYYTTLSIHAIGTHIMSTCDVSTTRKHAKKITYDS